MTYAFNPFTGSLDYTESTQTISPLDPGTIDNMAIGLNIPREGRFTTLGADRLELSDSGFEGLLDSLGVQTSVRIYVDSDAPASNDSASNRGRDTFRPFRTLERAFLEAARISKTPLGADYFSRIAVVVQPGRYLVDNRPGKLESDMDPLPSGVPEDYDSYQNAARLLDLNSASLVEVMFAAIDSEYTWPTDPTEEAMEILKWKQALSDLLSALIRDSRLLSNESSLLLSRTYRLPDGTLTTFTSAQAPFLLLGLGQLQSQISLVLGNDEATIPTGGSYQILLGIPVIPVAVVSFIENLAQLFLDSFETPLVTNPWSVELNRQVTPSLYEANPPRVILDQNQQPVTAAVYGKARDASRLLEHFRSLLLDQVLATTSLPSENQAELSYLTNKFIDSLIYDLATLSNQKCVAQARLYRTVDDTARVYEEASPFRAALDAALDEILTKGIEIISNTVEGALQASELVIEAGDPCSNEKATFATLVAILQAPFDSESLVNPWEIQTVPPVTLLSGGVVVPKGVSFVSVDLRKTEIVPTYLGEYRNYQTTNQPEIDYLSWDYPQHYSWASIFKVTGGTYSYGLTYRDIPHLEWTHHRTVAVSFANDDLEFSKTAGAYYYQKVEALFSNVYPDLEVESTPAEVEIVAPLTQLEVDSVEGASPYIYNCSLRSTHGMNGLWADGARVTGFKSVVSAQFTQVVLQTFQAAYQKWSDALNDWIPLGSEDQYSQLAPAIYESYLPYIDPLSKKPAANSIRYHPDWMNFGFKVSNESFSQLVSCFCIGTAQGYVSESGGDFSITNSNTNFGETAMYAEGFRPLPTAPDSGFVLASVVPPKPVLDDSIIAFKVSKLDGTAQYTYWNNDGGDKQTGRLYVNSLIGEGLIKPFTFKPGTKLHLRLPRTNQPSLELSVDLVEVAGEVFVNEIGESSTSSYFNINPTNDFTSELGIQLGDGISTDPVLIADKLKDAECLIKRVVDRRPLLDRAYHLRLEAPEGSALTQFRRPSFGFILNSSDNQLLNPLFWISDSRSHENELGQVEAYDITILGYEENGEPQPLTYSPYPLEDLDQEPLTDVNGLVLVPNVNPEASPTRRAVESVLTRLGVVYTDPSVVAGQLSEVPFEIEPLTVTLQFHRPSIIRCSGHTFEYAGYLNYSQGIPEFQQLNIAPEERLYKQRKNIRGGRCFYSGLDHEGLLWAGDKATNLSTGEVFELAIQETIPEIEIPARFSTLSANSMAVAAEINIGNGAVIISPTGITGGTITDITDLAITEGGTGASTAADARTNLGLGSISTQNANAVSITGGTISDTTFTGVSITSGTISGITDLAIADGGTGASDAATARTNLGLGSISTQDASAVSITGGTISGITDLAIADGGTGASDAATARTNLGLGTLSTQDANTVSIAGGTITGVPINIQSSETFPASPAAGNLFYNAATGRLFIYYQDGDSGQWVDAAPTSAGVTDIKLIDDISSQFNHSTTAFDLRSSGESVFPVSAQQLLIVLEDIVLSPGVDYTVLGSQIVFTSAPQSNRTFSGVIYGTSVTLSTVSDNAITTAKIQNASVTPVKLNLNSHVLPAQDNLYDLGSEALRFANLYTGDLHLKNDRGDWTLIEEETYLSLRNNKTGKRFRLQMTEIEEEI